MCISFQHKNNQYPYNLNVMKHIVDTVDSRQNLYNKKIDKLKYDFTMLPILPMMGVAGACILSPKQKIKIDKHFSLFALANTVIFAAYSFWGAKKTKTADNASLNSILKDDLDAINIYAKLNDKQKADVNKYNQIAPLINDEDKRTSIIYDYEYFNQAKFLKEIKHQAKQELPDIKSYNKEITNLLSSLDIETKKYSNTINNTMNIVSAGICGLGFLISKAKEPKNKWHIYAKEIMTTLMILLPVISTVIPVRQNIDRISRYKAKEKVFNFEDKQKKQKSSFGTFIDYLKNYKENIKQVKTSDAQTKANNELIKKIELTDIQKNNAKFLKNEFTGSFILSQKIKNSSKRTLLNDLTSNILLYGTPLLLYTKLLINLKDTKSLKAIIASLLSFFIFDSIINSVELNNLEAGAIKLHKNI